MLAYLDATSASMVTSVVVAGAAGTAVAVKTGWRRVTSPFRGKGSAHESADLTATSAAASWDSPGGEG